MLRSMPADAGVAALCLAADFEAMQPIHAISTRLLGTGDLTELLREILTAAIQLTGTDKGNLQLVQPESGCPSIVVHKGHGERFLERFGVDFGNAACGADSLCSERVLVENVATEPAYSEAQRRVLLSDGIRAAQATPLLSRSGQTVGMLNTYFRAPHRPGERELRFLDLLARMAADLIERAGAAQALRESEQRFAAIFSQAAGGIAMTDLDGRFTMVNERFCQIVGRGTDDLTRLHVHDITHPQDLPHNDELFRDAVSAGRHFTLEKRYLRPDGSVVWVCADVAPVLDAQGRTTAVLAVCQDISERKRTELLVAEQQRLLEMTAAGRSLDECMKALCAAVSRLDSSTRAMALVVDNERRRFVATYASDIDPSLGATLTGAAIDGPGIGTCGEAVRRCAPVTCADIAGDERWSSQWRERCALHRILACHSEPVRGSDGLPLGSFVLCFAEARQPTEWELQLASFGASVAGIAIERDRSVYRLRKSEERYRSLFESVDYGLCVMKAVRDPTGKPIDFRFVECNPAFVRYTGFEGAPGKTALEVVPDLDPKVIDACVGVVTTGEQARFEYYARDWGRWFDLHAFRFGKPDCGNFAVFFKDISRRKRAEAREHFFATLGDALRPLVDPVEIRDAAARVLGRHLAASRVFYGEVSEDGEYLVGGSGYADRVAPMCGRYRLDDFGPGGRKTAHEGHSLAQADVARDPALTQHEKATCRRLHVGAQVSVPLMREGRLAGLLAVHQAGPREWTSEELALIQETAERTWAAVRRALAEAARRESEANFRDLADNISQVVWIADAAGSIFWFNRRWFDYTGATLEQTRDRGWKQLVHPDHAQRVGARHQHSLDSGEPWDDTFPLLGHDGDYRWFLSRAMPIRDEDGHIVRWFGTGTDVTGQRTAEEALKEAARRKDEFLATLGHELRNPLAPIRYAMQVLRARGSRSPDVTAAREMIDRQVRQMVHLIDDLLDVSRITLNKLQLRLERVELGAAIAQAIETTRACAHGNERHLNVRLPEQPVFLRGDPARLAQVFDNLLSNAYKYSDVNGRIEVSAELVSEAPGRQQVVVRVRDDGIGVPAEHLPRLFEKFWQAAPALERSQGGLGVGLALVQGLVELHGGTISAASEGCGCGSEFTVRLPALDPPMPATPVLPASGGSPRRAPRRILVVDDNQDSAESLAMLLRFGGDEVETAFDGLEALAVAERFRPDIALLDIGMPKLNGYDTCRRLRESDWGKGVVVIAQTGWGQDQDRQHATEAGFDGHLVKPVDYDALTALLASLSPISEQEAGI